MRLSRRSAIGCLVAIALIAAAFVVPTATGWNVHNAGDRTLSFPPLDAYVVPRVAPSSLLALIIGLVVVGYGHGAAVRWRWGWLLVATSAASFGWIAGLAAIDGRDGFTVLGQDSEYLGTARGIDDIGGFLAGFIDRIPLDADGNWPVHVAGHPPGATLFFTLLDRLGLGGDLAAGLVVCALAATIPAAVLIAVRRVGDDHAARLVAPFTVVTPAAIWLGVSADAVFTVAAAWAIAALAISCTARGTTVRAAAAVASGLLFGLCAMFSYGLALAGLIALAVAVATRRWWPLVVTVITILAVIGAFALAGFALWDAFPVLYERYWAGLAAQRPWQYWIWGNLAALAICGGPAVWAGLASLRRRTPVGNLVWAAVAAVLIADLTLMSKAETERIWLPFVPWLTVGVACVSEGDRRVLLAASAVFTVVVAHVLQTKW